MRQYFLEFLFGTEINKKIMEEKELKERPFVMADNITVAKLLACKEFGVDYPELCVGN